MLARVDLYLELEFAAAVSLRGELEYQVHRVSGLLAIRFSKPGESGAYAVNRLADRFRLGLDEINVFRIPQRFSEQQLMDGRAAAKSDLSLQRLAAEQVAHRAADDQVLLHLPEIGPGRMGGPLLQVSDGDQKSISTGTLMTSFHSDSSPRPNAGQQRSVWPPDRDP